MKTTDHFKATIKEYLDRRASTDHLFSQSYRKENKDLDSCISYILHQVQKSGLTGFADDEIFSMAIHYYDEDDISVSQAPPCTVIVNRTIQLTDEEIEEAKSQARKRYEQEALQELRKKREQKINPKKNEATTYTQKGLF